MNGHKDENGFEVSDLHIIRLSRYAYSKLYRSKEHPTGARSQLPQSYSSKVDRFYLFDYFDELTHIADDNGSLQYEDCMGLDNPSLNDIIHESEDKKTVKNVLFPKNANITAVQSWSLVRLKSDNATPNDDPFKYPNNNKFLSDKPFLAIITVTINPEHYYFWAKNHNPVQSSRDFIQECLDSIRERINDFTKEKKNTLIKVLMSVNYGDFCVIMRTSDIRDAYLLTYKLRNSDELNEHQKSDSTNNNQSKRYNIRFSTFTTVGMETGLSNKKIPLSIGDRQIKDMGDHYYVLRLLADTSVLSKLNEYIVDNKPEEDKAINEPLGILGRYDISIRLSLKQFNQIYPLLCHYKLNMGGPVERIPRPEKNTVAYILDDEIRKGNIHVINERPLINMEDSKNTDNESVSNKINEDLDYSQEYKKSIDGFIEKLNTLKEEIDDVAGMANMLPYNRKAFTELMRLIKELYKTYIPMWYQHDSRTNIYMIYMILYMVVRVTKSYIKKINELTTQNKEMSKTDEKCWYAIQKLSANLMDSLNQAVYQINSLAKILQGINLQTIQMPNYEIQTQVDLEKYVVAFTEFLREFSVSYYQKFHGDYRNRIMPFITMDLTTKKVGANRLFQAIVPPEYNHVTPDTAELLNITIPSFECLARAYDLLMLLGHEITHSFRFIDRKKRNEYVIDLILSRMSDYIASQCLSMSSPSQNFLNVGSMIKLISGAVKESLIENCPIDEWCQYPLIYLESNMVDFFLNNVFTKRDALTTGNPVKSPVDTILDALKIMYAKARGVDDLYDPEMLKETLNRYLKLTGYIDENSTIVLDESRPKELQKCIIPKLRRGTALEEFYKTHNFNEAVQIKICEVSTLLPCLAADSEDEEDIQIMKKEVLNQLNEKLSLMHLYIDNNTVYMNPYFIANINDSLKYYATINLFFELKDFLLPKDDVSENLLTPFGLVNAALKKTVVDDAIRETIEIKFNEINKALLDLFEEIRVLESSFSAEDEEHLLEACHQVMRKLSLVGDSAKDFLDTDEYKQLQILVKISNEKITAFAQAICDISFHYLCVNKVLKDYPAGIPICSDHIRKRIIKKIHSKLNAAYNKDIGAGTHRAVLMSSQIHMLLSALCINSQSHKSFSENLQRCFYSFNDELILAMVKRPNEIYNEIVADFGMCAALALDAFGYLKFYVRYYHRSRTLNDDQSHDMTTERAATVICTLLSAEDSKKIPDKGQLKRKELLKKRLDLLKPDVKEYIRHVFKNTQEQIQKDIVTAIKGVESQSAFQDNWQAFSDELWSTERDYLSVLDAIGNSETEFTSCFGGLVKSFKNKMKFLENMLDKLTYNKCLNVLINNYFERFDRLYYMLVLLSRISQAFVGENEEDHLKDLYFEEIKHKTGPYCTWENADSETDARKAIGLYFNSTTPYEPKLSSTILKKTLAFILEYYYRNRLAFSQSPTFNDQWIKKLTGGNH